MEKVLGIVAEYNPFHNGHLYHLEEAKKVTGSKYSIAVIGGNFTQRGNVSVIDKWSKAEIALNCGVDLVLELPTLYATSSAENFADGAIKILNSLKIVDYIAFGAETTDISILDSIADILYKEPKAYKLLLSNELNKGLSFPKARENALMVYLGDIRKYLDVLKSPNNILGIEYMKALKRHNSVIQPVPIKRVEVNHNDIYYNGNIASGTAIRNIIKDRKFKQLRGLLPAPSYGILIENMKLGHLVPDISVFEKQIIYNLRKMSIEEISNLPDVTEGLEHSIKKVANSCNSINEFLSLIKSKRYTSTRIQRILLYSLLGITKKDINISKKILTPYVRVLGFTKRGQFLLSEIARANPKLEIVTSVKRFADSSNNKNLRVLMGKDIFATNVYTLGYDFDSCSNLDFTKKIVTI